MGTLFAYLLLYTALSAAFVIPLWIVGRDSHPDDIRKFLVAAVIVGAVVAVLASTSQRLTEQCLAARNQNCIDFGSAGMQTTVFAGFGFVALVRAYLVWRG